MQLVLRIGVLGAVSLVGLAAAAAPAAAARKPISGKLTKPGYAVLALGNDGEVTTVVPGTRRFRLALPAKRVSLHLRAADGTYAGPVVVGRERGGKVAVLGVEAGARLGTIKVNAARGYAKPAGELDERWIDARRNARAKRGVPIGAGSFGHVRSRRGQVTVPGDADRDGIPDALDVDDDGDLVLDALDDSAAGSTSASEVGPYSGNPCAPNPFCPGTSLFVPATATANSHVGSGDSTINETLRQFGSVSLVILQGGPVELDCGGENQQPSRPEALVYCRPHASGGTGMVSGSAFPDCCDGEDGDGLGTMVANALPAFPPVMVINHAAASEEIGTGDVLIQRIATSGEVSDCPPPGGMASSACTSLPRRCPSSSMPHRRSAPTRRRGEARRPCSIRTPARSTLGTGTGTGMSKWC